MGNPTSLPINIFAATKVQLRFSAEKQERQTVQLCDKQYQARINQA